MTVASDADELEAWARHVRVNPAALQPFGDARRRSGELVSSLGSIVEAATLRARQAESSDPFRAAMIIALLRRVQSDNAELFAKMQAGQPITAEQYQALWRSLLQVTSHMGDALPVDEVTRTDPDRLPNSPEARATVNIPIPGGEPTRLRGGGGSRPRPARPPSSPPSPSGSGGGWALLLVLLGGGALAAAAAESHA